MTRWMDALLRKRLDVGLRYAFEDWEFEPASGELRRGDGRAHRVQPQPALLLEMLLERPGVVVSREEIVDRVWPDTKVEFDQAVNYAIRHLRAALAETAADSRYIETLPRRGYRFKMEVTRLEAARPPARVVGRRAAVAGGALVVASLGLAVWGTRTGGQPGSSVAEPTAPVVAVLRLRFPEGDTASAEQALRISERITARLTGAAGPNARIVGPTTTEALRGGPAVLARLRAELGAEYMLAGRIVPEEPDGLFFELIRTSDAAHLWAMNADPGDTAAADRAADSVVARVIGRAR